MLCGSESAQLSTTQHVFLTWLQNFRITFRSWGFPQYGKTWRQIQSRMNKERWRATREFVWIRSTCHTVYSKFWETLTEWSKTGAAAMFPHEHAWIRASAVDVRNVMWKNVHIITSLDARRCSIVFHQSCFECSGSLSSNCIMGSFPTSLGKQTGNDLFSTSRRKKAGTVDCWAWPGVMDIAWVCICVGGQAQLTY